MLPFEYKAKEIHSAWKRDLLTGGLGWAGLCGEEPFLSENPAPFSTESRRLALWSAWNGLVPIGADFAQQRPQKMAQGIPISGQEIHFHFETSTTPCHSFYAMLHLPDGFDPKKNGLVLAPSSGSRGVYGAVPTVGSWALVYQHAVIYLDKGCGTDYAYAPTGQLWVPHAHSGVNPEAYWGDYALAALKHALSYTNGARWVIASSLSNGGQASLMAAERDEAQLIDAVVIAEPNVHLPDFNYTVEMSAHSWSGTVQPLFKQALQKLALRNLTDPAELSAWMDAGFSKESAAFQPMLNAASVWESVVFTFGSAYAQLGKAAFGGCSIQCITPERPPSSAYLAATSHGMFPSLPSFELRHSSLGTISGEAAAEALTAAYLECAQQIENSARACQMTGKLGSRPVLIVNGQADQILEPNHASRAYAVYHARQTGQEGSLVLIEVPKAQHLDGLLGKVPLLAKQYEPLLPHLQWALDAMVGYLEKNIELPQSQVWGAGSIQISAEKFFC